MNKVMQLLLMEWLILIIIMNAACQRTDLQIDEKMNIEASVNTLFIGVDDLDWTKVKRVMADSVLLDYTSMQGGQPVLLPLDSIIDSWKKILPGFDKTHHQLGNYLVSVDHDKSRVFCYGTASHYLANKTNYNLWIVVGTYEFEFQKHQDLWKIHAMKFNLKYIDGNTNLPSLAMERVREKGERNFK